MGFEPFVTEDGYVISTKNLKKIKLSECKITDENRNQFIHQWVPEKHEDIMAALNGVAEKAKYGGTVYEKPFPHVRCDKCGYIISHYRFGENLPSSYYFCNCDYKELQKKTSGGEIGGEYKKNITHWEAGYMPTILSSGIFDLYEKSSDEWERFTEVHSLHDKFDILAKNYLKMVVKVDSLGLTGPKPPEKAVFLNLLEEIRVAMIYLRLRYDDIYRNLSEEENVVFNRQKVRITLECVNKLSEVADLPNAQRFEEILLPSKSGKN
jgi:hypothetical protein